MKCTFDQITYFHRKYKPKPIEKPPEFIGIDSEAYDTGEPFMFALSDGVIFSPTELLGIVFAKKYQGKRFVCYNLQYEEGAILHSLPQEVLDTIRRTGKGKHNGYRYASIPKKELSIMKGHHSVCIYDIAQFYGTSLNKASLYYLGKEKLKEEVKFFTPRVVKRRWHSIGAYCIRDAELTKELADYFVGMLVKKFEIIPQKLYSTGYISGIHFSRTCEVIHVRRFWRSHKDLLKLAFLSYSGGKFETYQRGYSYLYQYDINSAYPYEISQLKDTRNAKILRSPKYQPDATYGFIDGLLKVTHDFSPVVVKNKELNFYPMGVFPKVITKQEYDYLIGRGDEVVIRDAYWLFCQDKPPYEAEVMRLYELKKELKGSPDKMQYELIKILLNSFYGKLIQITPKWKKEAWDYEAGYLFNPIYASVITANTRIKLAKVCEHNPDAIVAVHTDSIIACEPLHKDGLHISKEIGDWDIVNEGEGVVVGSGVYQVGDTVHYRGFKGIEDLIELVNQRPHRIKIPVEYELVLPWRLIVFRHRSQDLINRFVQESKKLDLHFDIKREWDGKWDWQSKLISSKPRLLMDIGGKIG